MLLMAVQNVLLLDEPTIDLDIATLTELEDLLDGFGGSIVVVSHDRYFLERVTDHVLALIGARLIFLARGVDEYLERLDAGAAGKPGAPPAPVQARPDVAAGGQSAGSLSGSVAGDLRDARKGTQADRQLERLTGRGSELRALAGRPPICPCG